LPNVPFVARERMFSSLMSEIDGCSLYHSPYCLNFSLACPSNYLFNNHSDTPLINTNHLLGILKVLQILHP
jgi:hypothetical protein